MHGFFDFKTSLFAPRLIIYKFAQEVFKSNYICANWSSSKTDLVTNFLDVENLEF